MDPIVNGLQNKKYKSNIGKDNNKFFFQKKKKKRQKIHSIKVMLKNLVTKKLFHTTFER
jgi:hypothetical protein